MCSVQSKDNCSPSELKTLEATLAIPEADRLAELQKIVADLDKKEEELYEFMDQLEAQAEAAQDSFEVAQKAQAPRIKELKAAGTKLPPSDDDDGDDDDDDDDDERDEL